MTTRRPTRPIEVLLENQVHPGLLALPENTTRLVLFAHGSGSSRLSSRNNYVADVLHQQGVGTLLFDLLTETEDRDYATRFDIELLTQRLLAATHWVQQQSDTRNLKLGYFGASTGAAAALKAAAAQPQAVAAVVSRGGRPDMAEQALSRVEAPTLLLVGGRDDQVIKLNQGAHQQLVCPKELSIIPGASHLFEEPGTLEQVAQQAADWFSKHLH
jgi:dienelactone hydrolase